VADLRTDTEVTGSGGQWQAEVSDDWDLWGPNGGYLAAIALRAVGLHAPGMRPASLECHFLNAARPGHAELTTQTLKGLSRAQSVRVSLRQGGRDIMAGLVWAVGHGLGGFPRRSVAAPPVPGPEGLKPFTDLVPPGHAYTESFWAHVEERPVNQARHLMWPDDPADEPVRHSWLRFRPHDSRADPFLEACRSVIAVDVFPFLAGVIVLPPGPLTHIAPTLALSVSFHSLEPASEWLQVQTESHYSGEGLLSGRSAVWGENGDLAASGRVQMLCRPLS
jgi:acyl-CoA thioesterase II